MPAVGDANRPARVAIMSTNLIVMRTPPTPV
jgi:hypothetical protein